MSQWEKEKGRTNHEVAIKQEKSEEGEARGRERELRFVASLSHPHMALFFFVFFSWAASSSIILPRSTASFQHNPLQCCSPHGKKNTSPHWRRFSAAAPIGRPQRGRRHSHLFLTSLSKMATCRKHSSCKGEAAAGEGGGAWNMCPKCPWKQKWQRRKHLKTLTQSKTILNKRWLKQQNC